MGLNFRKSISLGKNLKLNLGSKSSSISAGVPGARYSVSTNGTRRATFGIPGTGLSYTKTFGTKSEKSKADTKKKEKEKEKAAKEKELAKEKVAKEKELEIEKNEKLVEEYTESVGEVIGIHKDGVDKINWNKLSEVPSKYQPLRDGILSGDIDTYYQVIETVDPFDAILDFGSEFEIGTDDPKSMTVEFNIKAADVLPKTKVEMTASGKLSEKELSQTAYYDIFQDYVCSMTIRIARDLFALLPIEKVLVHAVDMELNTATGNDEEVTYLSVLFDRTTFEKINLDKIDPSDSLDNFEYNMKFAKTTGFKPVNKLDL